MATTPRLLLTLNRTRLGAILTSMTDTRRQAEAEAQSHFDESALRKRLREIRDSGLKRLTSELQKRNRHEEEYGPPRDTYGDPIPRPQLSDVESGAGRAFFFLDFLMTRTETTLTSFARVSLLAPRDSPRFRAGCYGRSVADGSISRKS